MHPGYVRPGTDLTDPKHFSSVEERKSASSCTSAKTNKPKVAGSASTSAAKVVKPLVKSRRKKAKRASGTMASSLPPLTPFIKECNRRLANATGEQLPVAWLEKAIGFAKEHPNKSADFLSVFDGRNGTLNKAAERYGLHGLPPVDHINAEAPLDM